MVVTRSMSGTSKKADTKIAVNHKAAERASKQTTAERASRQTMMKERKETFLKQFRDKYPDIKISPKVIDSGEEVWLSDNVAEVEKSLALDLILEAYKKDFIKKVNRAKSGTTAERASKKTTAERALLMKRTSTPDWLLSVEACALFMKQTLFSKQFREKYPDIKRSPKIINAGEQVWRSMTASAKASYIAQVEKISTEKLAHYEAYKQMHFRRR